MMELHIWKKYETVGGYTIKITWKIKKDEMILNFGSELLDILDVKDQLDEYTEELLADQTVVTGLTDNQLLPRAYRHAGTGKCIWGNTWGVIKEEALHLWNILKEIQYQE